MKEDTLPKLLRKNYQLYGDKKVAMRQKDFGLFLRYTWKDCYEKVRYFCLGLMSMGMERNDKVAIIGENEPELYCGDGICNGTDTTTTCSQDCGTPVTGTYYYVDPDDGNDNNSGSIDNPFLTIEKARDTIRERNID